MIYLSAKREKVPYAHCENQTRNSGRRICSSEIDYCTESSSFWNWLKQRRELTPNGSTLRTQKKNRNNEKTNFCNFRLEVDSQNLRNFWKAGLRSPQIASFLGGELCHFGIFRFVDTEAEESHMVLLLPFIEETHTCFAYTYGYTGLHLDLDPLQTLGSSSTSGYSYYFYFDSYEFQKHFDRKTNIFKLGTHKGTNNDHHRVIFTWNSLTHTKRQCLYLSQNRFVWTFTAK